MPSEQRYQPIADDVLDQAAYWFVTLHAGDAGAQEQQAWQSWLDASTEHRRAWDCATGVSRHFQGLPGQLTRDALNAPASAERRRAIRQFALLMGVACSGWLALREQPWQRWTTDYRTGTGERRRWRLDDGSLLDLNSASAVRVSFSGSARHLQLLEGELLLETGRDPRPLWVSTADGTVRPIGTRFSVAQAADHTRVAVFSGSVLLQPRAAQGNERRLDSGQGSRMHKAGSEAPVAIDEDQLAWLHGMLIADGMLLREFTARLRQERAGLLSCADEVAELRISGAFPLTDSDRALDSLAANLPVKIRRLTRYWVRIEPR